jgi:hypothetical protein
MSKDSLIDNLLGIPSIQIGRNPLLACAATEIERDREHGAEE